MKTLITILMMSTHVSVATPSVHACTNECWLDKNQDKVDLIAKNYGICGKSCMSAYNSRPMKICASGLTRSASAAGR